MGVQLLALALLRSYFVIFMLLPLSGSVSESGSKIPGSVPLDFASGFVSDCDPDTDTDPDTDYQRKQRKHGHLGIMEIRWKEPG